MKKQPYQNVNLWNRFRRNRQLRSPLHLFHYRFLHLCLHQFVI